MKGVLFYHRDILWRLVFAHIQDSEAISEFSAESMWECLTVFIRWEIDSADGQWPDHI